METSSKKSRKRRRRSENPPFDGSCASTVHGVETTRCFFTSSFPAADAMTPPPRTAPPVTTLIDMPPEMLMEIVQRVGDARALSSAACSCRALRDAAEDPTAWSSALDRALPGLRALLEASPPDWALDKMQEKKSRKSAEGSTDDTSGKKLKHPKLLLAGLASGKEFHGQVFNRELDNETEDFLLSCYDAKLSLERWRPSSGDDEEEEEEEEEGEEEKASTSSGVLTRARAAAAASAAAAAAAPPPPSLGEFPRSPRPARRRRRPEEEKPTAAAAAAAEAAAAPAIVIAASSRGSPTAQKAATKKGNKSSNRRKSRLPPGLPLSGISPTYTAKYLPMGRSLAVETGVGSGRLRAAPLPQPSPPSPPNEVRPNSSSPVGDDDGKTPPSPSLSLLSPGDAVEVQWKATESHPYGSWLGCVVSVFSPEGGSVAAATTTANGGENNSGGGGGGGSDGGGRERTESSLSASPSLPASTVDILFQQYSFDSPWQIVYSVPLLPPGSNVDSPVNGDPAFGFVGGVRGPLTRKELNVWETAWGAAEAAAVARGRTKPTRALSAGLPRAAEEEVTAPVVS